MAWIPIADLTGPSGPHAEPRTDSASDSLSVDGTVPGDMQITCTGNTVITPTGSPNGRMMMVEALASGAQRTVSVAGSVPKMASVPGRSVVVPSGQVAVFGFRYSSLDSGWILMVADLVEP